ncbi:unnamed protein product [Rotaria socialis]|uniref:Exosome complex component 10 homolog n=3 Tax=Rotaria socialis TaxID=392032 RepID=A0A817WL20_9BILA|nr:unnamed protein product [Rotaria socialis]CAF3356973.1 unnamed protein product [Rotaria socialis]CAF3548461.1 unnamed protein product [Rotaria socialis]CAF3771504.1 unnamed protein product [Rotaria socialis]
MSSTNSTKFLDLFNDVDEYKQAICTKVVDVIRTSNRLGMENFDRIMTIEFCHDRINQLSARILHRIYQMKSHIQSSDWDQLDSDEKLEQLVDINDTLFERIASALDDADGLKQSSVSTVVRQVVIKPQLKFKHKIDNSTQIPFIPKIRNKPHAQIPLPMFMTQMNFEPIGLDLLEKYPEILDHPYANEITSFEPDETVLKLGDLHFPKAIEQTKCLFVDTTDTLKTMMDHIEMQSELAIDLEHHSYRSYQGFTCLMQISSRTEDFLIDTLALRDELSILNNIFTNPKVLKVFHGADWDVEWLQKDFGIYIVNMFDTHQAGKELNLPTLSLAYLLKTYCNIDASKQYQLADWRLRPLPKEYCRYAQEDTHYLLYIYDRLRNQLIESNKNNTEFLRSVYSKSKIICLRSYKKPIFDENAYKTLYLKTRKTNFNGSQLAALKLLYAWRDKIAREEDESTSYVLPDLLLIHLAELLLKDPQGIRACCKLVPELVEKNLEEIHRLLIQAIEKPLVDLNDVKSNFDECLQNTRSI